MIRMEMEPGAVIPGTTIMSRKMRRGIVTLVILYAIFCLSAGILVAVMTVHPQRRSFPRSSAAILPASLKVRASPKDVAITTPDGLALSGWLIHALKPNGDAALLLHGLSDNRLGMIGYAQLLLAHGYTVVMPDARAHGSSDGTIATYGLLERDDIHQWVQWIKANEHPGCVFGLGESMGAAQLLQSLQNQSDFCAVVAESPFASFREIAYDRVGQYFHTGPWLGETLLRPLVEVAFVYGYKYGDLAQVSPESVVASSNVPVLLIHGENDHNIPIRHSYRIKALAPRVVLWAVPETDHCGTISTRPEEFENRLIEWFRSAPRQERRN